MSSQGADAQPGLTPQQFLGLKVPIHLPTLISTRGEDSSHLPEGHHTQALEISGIDDVLPIRTGYDLGSQEEFSYLSNTNEILTSCTVCCQLASLTPGAGGNSPRYVDDVLCTAIEKIEWLYGNNNPLEVIYGDELHFATLQETPEEELERKYALQAAGLTTAERVTLAAADQWVYLDIPWFWTKRQAGHWHAYAYGRPTRIRITWRAPGFVLQQNAAATLPTCGPSLTYIKKKFLRFHTVIPTEATKQVYMKRVEGKGDTGELTLFKDMQYQDFTIGAADLQTQVKCDMFTKFGYNLRFILRLAANLVPDVQNNERWRILDINFMQFDVANKVMFPYVDDWYYKRVYAAKWFLGNHELPIYNIPFTDYPDLHTQAMGGLEFSNVILPILKLWHDAPGATTRLTCWLYCHNYIRQCLRGSNSAMETVQPL
jgi:hypothetical protein